MALLTLEEAKTLLVLTSPAYNDELTDFISGAEEAVLFICGQVDETEVTEAIQACGAIALNKTPVLEVTSVTGDYWGAQSMANLRVNLDSGVIRAKGNVQVLPDDTYVVVYTTGRTVAPAAMKQAVKIILKHQWTTLRNSPNGRQSAVQDDATFVPGLGYAVPNAALQMLTPYSRGPAVG